MENDFVSAGYRKVWLRSFGKLCWAKWSDVSAISSTFPTLVSVVEKNEETGLFSGYFGASKHRNGVLGYYRKRALIPASVDHNFVLRALDAGVKSINETSTCIIDKPDVEVSFETGADIARQTTWYFDDFSRDLIVEKSSQSLANPDAELSFETGADIARDENGMHHLIKDRNIWYYEDFIRCLVSEPSSSNTQHVSDKKVCAMLSLIFNSAFFDIADESRPNITSEDLINRSYSYLFESTHKLRKTLSEPFAGDLFGVERKMINTMPLIEFEQLTQIVHSMFLGNDSAPAAIARWSAKKSEEYEIQRTSFVSFGPR